MMAVTPCLLSHSNRRRSSARSSPASVKLENRVQHHPLRADALDGVIQPDEQSLEVVVAGFLDLAAVQLHVVYDQPVAGDQPVEVVAQGCDVRREVDGVLLEGHEDAGFVMLLRARDQEGHGEQGLAAARSAAQQGGPAGRHAAARDLVEAGDTGRSLGQFLQIHRHLQFP
jgi:hypothetical protein